jgi:ketosteroid isomerase-like protein
MSRGDDRLHNAGWVRRRRGELAALSAHSRASGNPALDPRFRGDERKKLQKMAFTILRKQPDGKWVLSRDANLVS